MILVIDNYDSFTYNLVQLAAALGAEVRVERNDAVSAAQFVAMAPKGVIVSPGPGTPAEAGVSKDVVEAAAERGIPVLGVCLGHQAIGEVFGAKVVRGPRPVHGKTTEVVHDGGDVLEGVPSPFIATRYHSLVLDPASVPEELAVTARTADGVIMGIRHRDKPVFGVQFHPESVLTPEGHLILKNFLAICGEIEPEADREAAAAEDAPRGEAAQPGRSVTPTPPAATPTALQPAIRKVVEGSPLSEDEAHGAMGAIMDGEATAAQIASLVTALRMKGETVEEITGFARAMRERATPVRPATPFYMDTCGTGGDGLATFNISTAAAFVVAGAGVPIAKHGNRAVSSAAGSADVLEALGVRIDLSPEGMARCVDEAGVGFLFAQALHASMRHAAGARREIGVRTVFNVLGPLTNPAGARNQLLGVYDASLVPVIAEVAGRLGAEHVLVVHGHPGMDEVSASGPTLVGEYRHGRVHVYEIEPERVGVRRAPLSDFAGGDAASNAGIILRVLQGEPGGHRDVVLMNAAAALLAADAVPDLSEGLARARRAIDSGEAYARLQALLTVSRRLAEEAATTAGDARA